MKKSALALILAVLMAVGLLTIGASAATPDGSANNPFTTVEQYNNAVKNDGKNGKDVYLTITGQSFNTTDNLFDLANVQNRANPPKLHLTLINCKFTGNTYGDTHDNDSFMYLSNCQELRIDNCKFDAGTDGLVYGINWNLIQIKDAVVTITNCSFEGKFSKNPLKLNQRNGDDDTAGDVNVSTGEFAANIKSAVIDNCTFNCTKADGTANNVIQLGSQGKNDGNAAPSTGAFPVTIATGSGEVTIEKAYAAPKNEEIPTVSVPANSVVTKTANGDPEEDDSAAVFEVNGQRFITLSAAISAADDGDTIHMLQSYDATNEGTVTFDSGKDVTLNLGGYTLTVKRFNLTHGWLTVENGKVECAGQAFNVYAAPDASNETDYTKLVIGDTATINAAYGICLFPGSGKAGYSSSIEVYGNIASGGIFVSGNLGNDDTTATAMAESDKIPTITIHEGAVVNSSTEAQGISMNGLANVTVDGGTITGREAIGVKRGTLTVNGGTFK